MSRVLIAALCFACLFACGKDDSGGSDSSKSQKSESGKQGGSSAAGASNETKIDGEAQQKAGIRVADAHLRAVPEYLTAAGQIVVDEERTAHVGTYTDGRILEVDFSVGDFVRKGSVMARMHSHDVHETRAAYESALEEVSRAENRVAFQTRQHDRMLRLLELKSASPQEVESSETDLRSAQTDLANAHISVTKEATHLSDILHLPEDALRNINETTELVPVIAPLSGTVIDRKLTPGMVVETGQEVFTVSDLSTVWMMASVNETDMQKLRVGDRARLLTEAFPQQEFPGRITHLGPELDPQTRTLMVRIVIANPAKKLRPAMYANAQIDEGPSRQAIFLPEDAVQDINGSSVVFVRKPDNVFEARSVQLRNRLNGEVEISAGLRPGEAVVVKGSFVVKSQMLKSQIGE